MDGAACSEERESDDAPPTAHPPRASRTGTSRSLEAFHTLRQVAREELRDLARYADAAPYTLDDARTRLERAATAEDVVAVEPYVLAARATLGVAEPEGHRSYQSVLGAARLAPAEQLPGQRVTRTRVQDRNDHWHYGN